MMIIIIIIIITIVIVIVVITMITITIVVTTTIVIIKRTSHARRVPAVARRQALRDGGGRPASARAPAAQYLLHDIG